jgi:hypothetical protein
MLPDTWMPAPRGVGFVYAGESKGMHERTYATITIPPGEAFHGPPYTLLARQTEGGVGFKVGLDRAVIVLFYGISPLVLFNCQYMLVVVSSRGLRPYSF